MSMTQIKSITQMKQAFWLLTLALVLYVPAACAGTAGAAVSEERSTPRRGNQPEEPWEQPEFTIYRAGTPITVDGRLDEPAWTAAPDIGKFVFPRYQEGEKEYTVAKVLWDDHYLYLAFICQDKYIWAEHTEYDSRVYMDDTVELFTAPDPDRPHIYYNIEMNVLGIWLDQYHPEGPGVRAPDFDFEGVQVKTTIVGSLNNDDDEDEYWILEAAIPFANFRETAANTPPQPGDVWHMNLNRLGGKTNPQHSSWSSTGNRTFHVPDRFGRVIFSDRSSPFWR